MNRIRIARPLYALPVLLCWGLLTFNAVGAGPPPVITLQPASQTVVLGGTATFAVQATSGTALTYQWYYQGTAIAGATNRTHLASNAQFTNAGVYSVALVNAGGTVSSTNAVLTIKNAPILSGANDLTAINEDEVNNGGTLVSSLIAGQVTDPDPGAVQGIAVVAVNNTVGTWQYSTNAGAAWTAFGNPSEASARLLASDPGTYVRLVPNTNWNGHLTDGITFRCWDLTSGTVGATAIAGSTGTFSDTFSAATYANNNGTDRWNGNWVDIDGSPTSGTISIASGILGVRANNTIDWIYREANLSGVTNAVVSFNFDSELNEGIGGRIDFQVSKDGGTNYTTLATFSATNNSGIGTFSADISAYAAAQTRVRFVTVGKSQPTKSVNFDNVQIAYLAVGGTTAFSANTAISGITVNPAVFPAPTLTGQMIPGSGFQVEFSTLPNTTVLIEASTNLVEWETLVVTNSGNGLVRFMDQDVTSYPERFYRSAQIP